VGVKGAGEIALQGFKGLLKSCFLAGTLVSRYSPLKTNKVKFHINKRNVAPTEKRVHQ
jgi:hypothetical protein